MAASGPPKLNFCKKKKTQKTYLYISGRDLDLMVLYYYPLGCHFLDLAL